jgi:hypothetical protein
MPTTENPIPQLELGYKKPVTAGRRKLLRSSLPVTKKRRRVVVDSLNPDVNENSIVTATDNLELERKQAAGYDVRVRSSIEYRNCEMQASVSMVDASLQWEELHLVDHSYVRKSVTGKVSMATQVALPAISSNNLNEKSCKFYTGLSLCVFVTLVSCMRKFSPNRIKCMCEEDQLLVVLMKLRLGLLHNDLAYRFNVSSAAISLIFSSWLPVLSEQLKQLIVWLPRDVIKATMPACFRKLHAKTTCIIDCSEVFIQRPQGLLNRAVTYSNYKSHNTTKFLVCISPKGSIMFVSPCYGGRASDRFITNNSGFLGYLLPGDSVMADRGFTIQNDLLPYGVSLNIPVFRRGLKQLHKVDVIKTRRIATVRIHVERVISKLKNFRILKCVIPTTLVPLLDDIVMVCCALCNLQSDIVRG